MKGTVKKPAPAKKPAAKKPAKAKEILAVESTPVTEVAALEPEVNTSLTYAQVQKKFDIELVRNGYQKMQSAADALVFNEDNVDVIKETLGKFDVIVKKVEELHESGKRPYYTIGKHYDNAKNATLELIKTVQVPVKNKFQELCRKIAEEKEKQRLEELRKDGIKLGIQNNIIAISQMIADAVKVKDLDAVEKTIEAQKANKAKYQEFHEDAIVAYGNLLPIIAEKRAKLVDLASIDKKLALKKTDEATALELEEKKEAVQSGLEETGIKAQESAANSLVGLGRGQAVSTVLPNVKPKRQAWKWEIEKTKTLADVYKEKPSWVNLSTNGTEIARRMSEIRESVDEGVEEHIEGGIRFFLHKEY
jgi:hypothetical protein